MGNQAHFLRKERSMIKSKKASNQIASVGSRKVKIAAPPAPIPEPIRKKLRFKKVTGGIFLSGDGQTVKKDGIFTAFPEDISDIFKNDFICLDAVKPAAEPGIKVGLSPAGNNLWNVVNILTGDILNDAPLKADSAKAFLEEGEELPSPKAKKLSEQMKDVGKLVIPPLEEGGKATESKKDAVDDEEEFDD
jgi:hypothetical protein